MNNRGKKFISPNAWFSLVYPQNWYEFEDSESTFLFYNPDVWAGNFRISAFKADNKMSGATQYAKNTIKEELRNNETASLVTIGEWECAYSRETFQENGNYYTTHLWITGVANIVFECTFTVEKGGDKKPAEEIISTLEARKDGKNYPAELIPVRVSEIVTVNEAFEWTVTTVKKQQKKDFTGIEEDIPKLQQLVESDVLNPKKREAWQFLGMTLGVMLVNEIEGIEWATLIDNGREEPVLRYVGTDKVFYPRNLFWDKIKDGKQVNVRAEWDHIIQRL